MKPLTRIWWVLLLRGVVAISFGLAAFAWSHDALIALAYLFGVYALADGLFAIWTGIHLSEQKPLMRSLLMEGVTGIGVGIIALLYPGWIVIVGIYLIAAWALVTGLLEIFAARELHRDAHNDWHPSLMGFLSLLCGLLILIFPHQSKAIFAWIIGGYAFAYGVTLILFAFRLRGRYSPAHHSESSTPGSVK